MNIINYYCVSIRPRLREATTTEQLHAIAREWNTTLPQRLHIPYSKTSNVDIMRGFYDKRMDKALLKL